MEGKGDSLRFSGQEMADFDFPEVCSCLVNTQTVQATPSCDSVVRA
jgi:hypothetical protein